MSACTQPGCTGTIDGGFCTVCGMKEAPAQQEAAPQEAAPGGGFCVSCGGKIEEGYCSSCGMAAEQEPAASAASAGGTRPSRSLGFTPSASVRTGSTSRRRGLLGMGLVEVPPVPYRNPSEAVLADPEVAEHKRFCSNPDCGEAVGRSRGGRPGRPEGFCPKCGTGYSYTPKLGAGDLIGGQYEVLGCIAHGGLGWIYLGRDRNVSNRWVVLKGLLDTGDADAMEAAVAERAFLAQVEHPRIVKIYNFVQHEGSGYIVMEYVGGRSLRQILEERRAADGATASLPLGQVIAYGLEVLRAFAYLHDEGLVFCDLKPDNVIQSREEVKLIDLGAVRHLDDAQSAIFGTHGYQAPEIATYGPSISSDLFTVGRTMAVLAFPFKGFTSTYATTLPPMEELGLPESFDRLLRRATHEDPAHRFQDAAEMSDQLTGVLREVMAAEDGQERPAPSALFGPEEFVPNHDIAPPGGSVFPPLDLSKAAQALPEPLAPTPELGRLIAGVSLRPGDQAETARLLDEFKHAPGDWRLAWCRAALHLATGRLDDAYAWFDALYGLHPGEAAPKLALAATAECLQWWVRAAHYYELVWRTDHTYVSAIFGLARVRLARGDIDGGIGALDEVPNVSSHYMDAQVAAVAAAARGEHDLIAAGRRLEGLQARLDRRRYGELAAELLEAVLRGAPQAGTLLGVPVTERKVRGRLEGTLRDLAKLAQDREDRHALVNRANAVRPRTWF